MTIAFEVGETRAQIELEIGFFHEWTLPDGSPWLYFYRVGEGYLLRFPSLADFHVSNTGALILCSPIAGVEDETLRHLYLNQVLPLAQSRQHQLVFHASAVEINGGAVAFLGESGRGKSTLAASFSANGFRFLADDGLVIHREEEIFHVLPSHPSIRLWQDSEEVLIHTRVERAPPVMYTQKSRLLAGGGINHCDQSRPLRRLYLLEHGAQDEPVFTRVPARDAVIELMKNSFMIDLEDRALLESQLRELTSMVAHVSVYHLNYPRRFADLDELRQRIQVNLAE